MLVSKPTVSKSPFRWPTGNPALLLKSSNMAIDFVDLPLNPIQTWRFSIANSWFIGYPTGTSGFFHPSRLRFSGNEGSGASPYDPLVTDTDGTWSSCWASKCQTEAPEGGLWALVAGFVDWPCHSKKKAEPQVYDCGIYLYVHLNPRKRFLIQIVLHNVHIYIYVYDICIYYIYVYIYMCYIYMINILIYIW